MKRWRVSLNEGEVIKAGFVGREYVLGAIKVVYVIAVDELGAWVRAQQLWEQEEQKP